jgi:hypothetical protein
MSTTRYKSFAEFWPFYIGEHSRTGTRVLHYIGTVTATICVVLLLVSGRWWLFPLGLIPGYSCAWIGHFFIEKNRPATFSYPVWSFLADYKMTALMLTGKLRPEITRVHSGAGR